MKQRLLFFQEQLIDFEDKLTSFIKMTNPMKSAYTKACEIAEDWSKIIKYFDEIQQHVTPVEAIEVKFPKTFTPGLANKWKLWKDYLAEQHNIHMKSRYEIESLGRLMKLAENNSDKASEILSLAMATGYKNFFSADKKDETNKILQNDSTFATQY